MRFRCYGNTRRHPVVQSILFFLILLSQTATSAYSSLSLAEEKAVPVATEHQSQVPHQIHSADAQKLGVGQNIQFVEQLVNHSAAAKQIQQGDNAKAKALQQKALQELKRAKQAQQAGDTQTLSDALHEAKSAMFQAIRMSGEKEIKEKQQRDFKARVKSVTALLDAHKRIRLEKKLGQPAIDVEQHVASEIQSAENDFNKGQLGKAMTQVNTAYLSIKLSVMRLRDGDTLVRELHFETKQDEYKYELERNRTHRILVEVVLKEKLSPQMSMLMKTPMAKAEELRARAVQQAEGGDYEQAIHTLEQSTQQIIRAIRMAGVYIPG
jgi:hypothetical protein